MINISEPQPTQSKGFLNHALWQLPFRSFFILAAIASIASILAWVGSFNSLITINSQGLLPVTWHAHEMIFGFGITVAIGFILTAVQTWTGLPSISGAPVIALVVLWLMVRTMLWTNTQTTLLIASALQFIWWLSVISIFARLVFNANNKRNYIFIPLFTLLACLQLSILILSFFKYHDIALHLTRSAVMLFLVIITLIGGRVIPFFTVRGAQTEAIVSNEKIEAIVLPITLICALIFIVSFFFKDIKALAGVEYLISAVFTITGIIHVLRISNWRSFETFNVPLLWSLHLSYFAMALGMILIGISFSYPSLLMSTALHVITVGTIGLMILAMISRVSLGHTGRMLQVKPIITFSFILMVFATLIRVLLPLLGYPLLAWNISAIAWAVAFSCFVIVYWPILSTPRK